MNIYKYILGILRVYPCLIITAPFFSYFITGQADLLLLSIILMLNDILNGYLKLYVFYPLMKDSHWPILGKGNRPDGARNCGLFLEENAKLSTSYGMPSGHSQGAVFFSMYTILCILNSNMNIYIKIL